MKSVIVIRSFLAAAAILLIPSVTSFFMADVSWSLFDYAVAAALLFIFFLGLWHVKDSSLPSNKKLVRYLLITFVFVVIWAELAVGIFGSPFAGS